MRKFAGKGDEESGYEYGDDDSENEGEEEIGYEYEDDESENEGGDGKKEKELKNDNEKVYATVWKQLQETKSMADGMRFRNLVNYEKGRLENMTLDEIKSDIALVRSFIAEAIIEVKGRMEILKAQVNRGDVMEPWA